MESPTNKLLLCAVAVAVVALPGAAAAAPVIPPENSAATQYTEAIPTGGGQKDAGGSGHDKERSPSSVLGPKKAKKLNAQGPSGHAVAQLAAETAPRSAPAPGEATPEPSASPSEPAPTPQHEASHGVAQSHPRNTNGGTRDDRLAHAPPPSSRLPQLKASRGSSGLAEVLGQTTGASPGGELGLLGPLLILATLVWALLYGLRRRRPAV